MTEKIQTKIFNYGDENESEWPPKYGTGGSGVYYFDKETQTFKSGYPPLKNIKFGEAPYIIPDSMPAYRHPSTGQVIESKSALRAIDNATNTITTDKPLPANKSFREQNDKARRQDLHNSMKKAIAQLDAGTAPLTEEQRQMCERQNEIVSSALNFDAFNVAGRKKNAKGKRFRRK